MIQKGFWSAHEFISSYHIELKFRRLVRDFSNNALTYQTLLLFIEDTATQSLFLFLEATCSNSRLESLCRAQEMNTFWDSLIITSAVTEMVGKRNCSPTFDHFRPQTSLSSYQFIKGCYFFHLARISQQQRDAQHTLRETRYLNLAQEYHSFHAMASSVDKTVRLLSSAIRNNKALDTTLANHFLPKYLTTAKRFGSAGLLVIANLSLYLSKYFADVIEDREQYFHYLITAYSMYLQAQRLSSYDSTDVHNALVGRNLESLLPDYSPSILSAIHVCRSVLSDSGFSEKRLEQIEQQAHKDANRYCVSFYFEQHLALESSISSQ